MDGFIIGAQARSLQIAFDLKCLRDSNSDGGLSIKLSNLNLTSTITLALRNLSHCFPLASNPAPASHPNPSR